MMEIRNKILKYCADESYNFDRLYKLYLFCKHFNKDYDYEFLLNSAIELYNTTDKYQIFELDFDNLKSNLRNYNHRLSSVNNKINNLTEEYKLVASYKLKLTLTLELMTKGAGYIYNGYHLFKHCMYNNADYFVVLSKLNEMISNNPDTVIEELLETLILELYKEKIKEVLDSLKLNPFYDFTDSNEFRMSILNYRISHETMNIEDLVKSYINQNHNYFENPIKSKIKKICLENSIPEIVVLNLMQDIMLLNDEMIEDDIYIEIYNILNDNNKLNELCARDYNDYCIISQLNLTNEEMLSIRSFISYHKLIYSNYNTCISVINSSFTKHLIALKEEKMLNSNNKQEIETFISKKSILAVMKFNFTYEQASKILYYFGTNKLNGYTISSGMLKFILSVIDDKKNNYSNVHCYYLHLLHKCEVVDASEILFEKLSDLRFKNLNNFYMIDYNLKQYTDILIETSNNYILDFIKYKNIKGKEEFEEMFSNELKIVIFGKYKELENLKFSKSSTVSLFSSRELVIGKNILDNVLTEEQLVEQYYINKTRLRAIESNVIESIGLNNEATDYIRTRRYKY